MDFKVTNNSCVFDLFNMEFRGIQIGQVKQQEGIQLVLPFVIANVLLQAGQNADTSKKGYNFHCKHIFLVSCNKTTKKEASRFIS